ncbi:MAG: PQQ-binding-like beta-propeller repeat protein, partial [Cohnella sp.]|nr:PQQ-binding-like beta-propeller repeat protein [Cohnella sp.]
MRRLAFVRIVVLALLASSVAGCKSNGATQPTPSVLETSIPSPSPMTSTETPAAITKANVRDRLAMDMTPEQVRQSFGGDYESRQSSLYWGMQWIDTERWEYGDPASGAKLLLEWSGEGRLLYAVLYGKDASGRTETYVPAMGALKASSSEDNPYAAEVAVDPEKTVHVAAPTLGYDMIGGSAQRVSYLARVDRPLHVIAMNATFAEVDDDGVNSWIPAWQLTSEAARAKRIDPIRLKAVNDAQALWAPKEGSEASASVHAGDTLFALQQFDDWYGVAVPPSDGRRGIELAWVPKKDVQPSQEWAGLYAETGADDADTIAAVVRSELGVGASRERIERIFGKPAYEESSNNVEMPGKLRTLTVSRYESDTSQLAITWEESGALLRYAFHDRANTMDFGISSMYGADSPTVLRPETESAYKPLFAPSAPLAFEWRTRTELPFNFLVGEAGGNLIVAGEDGGFSGMHESSHLYGIDRKSGAIVWKHDFGHDRQLYALSEDGRFIAFIDKIESKVEESAYDLFVLNTATGKKLWNKSFKVKGAISVGTFVSSGSVTALSYTTTEGDKHTTRVEARKIDNGSLIWSRTIGGEGELLPQDPAKRVFVLQTGTRLIVDGKLTALDPKSGTTKWELPER